MNIVYFTRFPDVTFEGLNLTGFKNLLGFFLITEMLSPLHNFPLLFRLR
jgi:hypothetical protein